MNGQVRRILLGALTCGALLANERTVHAILFVPLSDLPGGTANSVAYALSGDGTVAAGRGNDDGGYQPIWFDEDGAPAALDRYPASGTFFSTVWGIDRDGSTLVGESNRRAVRWNALGELEVLNVSGSRSVAYAASADGDVVVGKSSSGSRSEAFVVSGGVTFYLGDLSQGVFASGALDVSADGSTVVGFGSETSLPQAMSWTANTGMVGLGFLSGGDRSEATGVSANGDVIVGWSSRSKPEGSGTTWEAFRWTAETGMVGLGSLPTGNYYSRATAVSGDGSVVVGTSQTSASGSDGTAFIWDSVNGMRELKAVLNDLGVDVSGWRLLEATDISYDGNTISGYGLGPNSVEGWRVNLAPVSVPESPPWLVLLGGAALVVKRRRAGGEQRIAVGRRLSAGLRIGVPSRKSAVEWV